MFGRDLKLRLQEDYRRLRAWMRSEASTTGGLQEASCLGGIWGFDYRRTTGGLVLGWDQGLRLQEDYRRLRAWVGSETSTTGGLQEAS